MHEERLVYKILSNGSKIDYSNGFLSVKYKLISLNSAKWFCNDLLLFKNVLLLSCSPFVLNKIWAGEPID